MDQWPIDNHEQHDPELVTDLPCAEKIAFATQQQAEAAAAADAYYHGSRLKAYQCRYCTAWHLSSRSNDDA